MIIGGFCLPAWFRSVKMREIADSIGAYLLVDIPWRGPICRRRYPEPVPHRSRCHQLPPTKPRSRRPDPGEGQAHEELYKN
ncbi:hypothetical protein KCP73_19935 [Salmonella enterica subsp. enterica]|nr:hypothetical protein KCP73_19935 [Salmonella enterica subsp. enterica]